MIARRTARACSVIAAFILGALVASSLYPTAMADESPSAATWQATRFPTAEQLRCKEPLCAQGLLIDPMFTGIEFRDDRIIGGGAFADAPGYRSKVSAFWADVPTRQSVSGGVALSLNVAAFTTVARAKDAAIADAIKEGIGLTKATEVGLDGSWFGDSIAPDGTRLRYAYVVAAEPEPTVVRGVCALWGASRRSASCSIPNLLAAITAITRRQPTAPPLGELAQPLPGLNVVLVTTLLGPSAWAAESPGADLLAAMADATTTVSQHVPTGQPSLAISLRSVSLAAGADAGTFIDSPCAPSLPGTVCRSQALADGVSLRYTSLKDAPRKVVQMQVRAVTGQRLVIVDCSRPRDFSALTAIQQRSCRTLGAQLAAQEGAR